MQGDIAHTTSNEAWNPRSWQNKHARHQPRYDNAEALEHVVKKLALLPPLVTSWEIEELKSKFVDAAEGKKFILQGGDCAESFDDCRSDAIASKIKVLMQMSLIVGHGTKTDVVRVGRFAGQYAKPRSTDTERRGDITLPSYYGDLYNKVEFSEKARTPNPDLLLAGYKHSALTLNFIRSLMYGGFADVRFPEYWELTHKPEQSKFIEQYQRISSSIRATVETLHRQQSNGMGPLGKADFYTSHEGLSLWYEQAQTRKVPRRKGWYNLSTHMPWIGKRTSNIDGAHVEYFKGIENPIGIKIGPEHSTQEVLNLCELLNPKLEKGKLVLIHRFGMKDIERKLPELIQKVQKSVVPVVWMSDPMHGNTELSSSGLKTRHFSKIKREMELAFEIHGNSNSRLSGLHFEMTGDDVTECLGGSIGLSEMDLKKSYKSPVDPRLNYEQSLEIAIRLSELASKSTQKQA